MEAGVIICPDCKRAMIRITAKVEGKPTYLWLCNCKPTQEQQDKWELVLKSKKEKK